MKSVMFRTSVVCAGHQLYDQNISCIQEVKLVREAASSSSSEDHVDISRSDLRIGSQDRIKIQLVLSMSVPRHVSVSPKKPN